MQLTENLYSYPWEGYENNCNCIYFGGDLRVLVDVGHERFVDDLFGRLAGDGVDPEQMRMVIVTHSHPDHLEGIQRFANMGIPIGMHPAAVEYLESAGDIIYQFLASHLPDFVVTDLLEEGPVEALDGALEVYNTPGHEPGSLCVHWPAEKALVTGDLIFAGGVGRTDFPGGSHETLMREISRISDLDVEHILPGHGPVISGRDAVRANYANILRMFA